MAHLTGGGFYDNIPRVLPEGLDVVIKAGAWPVPPIFELIEREGRVSFEEMHRVFNMGVGMTVFLAPGDLCPRRGTLEGDGPAVVRDRQRDEAGKPPGRRRARRRPRVGHRVRSEFRRARGEPPEPRTGGADKAAHLGPLVRTRVQLRGDRGRGRGRPDPARRDRLGGVGRRRRAGAESGRPSAASTRFPSLGAASPGASTRSRC
jgi:hypothetical protein